jgi:hypothetical protein
MALLCELLGVPKNTRWGVGRVVAPYLGWGVIALVYYYCRTAALGSGLGAPAIAYGTFEFWRGAAHRQLYYMGQLFWPAQRLFDFAVAGRARGLVIWLGLLGVVTLVSIIWLVREWHRSIREARVAVFFGFVWPDLNLGAKGSLIV